MKIEDAVRLALREFADPHCGRCGGAGFRRELRPESVCRCVRGRVPPDAEAAPEAEALPHPWGAITRRAQEIHAAASVDHVPDVWSG
jgi:hypothetical protein